MFINHENTLHATSSCACTWSFKDNVLSIVTLMNVMLFIQLSGLTFICLSVKYVLNHNSDISLKIHFTKWYVVVDCGKSFTQV